MPFRTDVYNYCLVVKGKIHQEAEEGSIPRQTLVVNILSLIGLCAMISLEVDVEYVFL